MAGEIDIKGGRMERRMVGMTGGGIEKYMTADVGTYTPFRINSMFIADDIDTLRNYIWKKWREHGLSSVTNDIDTGLFAIYRFKESGEFSRKYSQEAVHRLLRMDDIEVTVRKSTDDFTECYDVIRSIPNFVEQNIDIHRLIELFSFVLESQLYKSELYKTGTTVTMKWRWGNGEYKTKQITDEALYNLIKLGVEL